jgi:hypothetical protein
VRPTPRIQNDAIVRAGRRRAREAVGSVENIEICEQAYNADDTAAAEKLDTKLAELAARVTGVKG